MGSLTRLATTLLLLTACNSSDVDDDVACTEVGCGSSGAQFQLGAFAVADVAPTATNAAEFEVCLNDKCSKIVLGELPGSESIEIRGAVVVPNVTMSGTFAQAGNGMINALVTVLGPDARPFHDGDGYRVKVTSTDGRVLADRSWTVDYKLAYPNGPQCEPACAQVSTMTER